MPFEARAPAGRAKTRYDHGMKANRKTDSLGQFFTPPTIVRRMLCLRQNSGRVLEPSAGNGAFLSMLGNEAVGIEIDDTLSNDPRLAISDFFAYPITRKFETIIGNPPYVRFQDIPAPTKALLPMDMFDKRSNLYLFFIAKCMAHLTRRGELIFITPRDFLKSTGARKLNEALHAQGCITHYYELGDAVLFDNAAPNCAIWRWEKGRADKRMQTGGRFHCRAGQIWFGDKAKEARLGDFFEVKVGAVSGADDVFVNARHGNTDMVYSQTATTGKTRKVIYNEKHRCLRPHKPRLLRRKIRAFDESNWWQWGRAYCHRPGPRIYVNGKTRAKKPFFASEHQAYDGSVLALFPKRDIDLGKATEALNKTDWQTLGFVCDGRLLFTQRSLENAAVVL